MLEGLVNVLKKTSPYYWGYSMEADIWLGDVKQNPQIPKKGHLPSPVMLEGSEQTGKL